MSKRTKRIKKVKTARGGNIEYLDEVGEDQYGTYQRALLSMTRGGKGKPYNVYMEPSPHLVLDTSPSPRGWYKGKNESDRVRPRPCYTEALLTTPYGGFCSLNCAHCYVNGGTRGYRATGLPAAHVVYPDKLRAQIAKINVSGAGYITSFSEPFHQLEPKYHVTRRLAQVFIDEGLPIFYLSRSIPPDWAIDTLQENAYSYMQWSINTGNPDHYRKMSPGSYDLDDVYERIQDFSEQGIFVSIQVNPIVAGITKLADIMLLLDNLKQAGAHHCIFKFVEQVANNRKSLMARMGKRGLPDVDKFDKVFSQVIGGVYTVAQDVRVEWLKAILEHTRKLGLTMSTCYEYYNDGHAGSNLAPWFTTSDQCHGRGVPVYYRPSPGAPFQPVPGCYRKGCLYCSDYGTRACGNDKLLHADAMEYKDLRETVIREVDDELWAHVDSCLMPEDAKQSTRNIIFYSNPKMLTDAEMWGWGEVDEIC